MRVLFIGNHHVESTSRFYAEALKRLGHEVTYFDPRLLSPQQSWQRLYTRLLKRPLPRQIANTEQQLELLCKENSFDWVLVFAENFLSPQALDILKSSGALLIYHSHDNNFSPGILKPTHFFQTLKEYDFVFTTKSQNVKRYQEGGQAQSFFLPSAYETSVHRPIEKRKSRFGDSLFAVTFIGTYDRSRDPYLASASWENLYVWGNGWRRYKSFSDFPSQIVPRAVYNEEFSDILSHSKISLGLLREEAGDLHTQRTFEIPACGALQISPRNEEILSFFDESREIVCFESQEELKDKIKYYLSHEEERKRIAAAGRERVLKDKHSYQDRVEKIIELIR